MSKKSWFEESKADIWSLTDCEICEAFRDPICLCLQQDIDSGIGGGKLMCPKLTFSKEDCIEMYKEGKTALLSFPSSLSFSDDT